VSMTPRAVNADQTRVSYPVAVEGARCANGETWEFWLTLDGLRVSQPHVFRTIKIGDSLSYHAAAALKTLLASAS